MSFASTIRWSALGSITLATALCLVASGCQTKTRPTPEEHAEQQQGTQTARAGETAKPKSLPPPALKLQTVRDQKPAPGASEPADSKGKSESKPKSESAAKSDVSLKRLVVTHAIEEREPAPVTELALGDAPVIAFVELVNRGDEDGSVVVTFEHEGIEPVGHVRLEVPAHSRRWRTWARTRMIKKPGSWQAVVRTPEGQELARKSFEVAP